MAEPTLSLTYTDILRELGIFADYGADTTAYSSDETAELDRYIQRGYRQFLFPPPRPNAMGVMAKHIWSFLSPTATLSITSAAEDYDLPDNFGGIRGTFTYVTSGPRNPINEVGEGSLRRMRSENTPSGEPTIFAIRPKSNDGTTGQRFEVLFYPYPNADRTLKYAYNVIPEKLTTTALYPLGGADHCETVLASCLTIAEQYNPDAGSNWKAVYDERLDASIAHDQQTHTPETLGYNSDDPRIEVMDPHYGLYDGERWGTY